MITRTTNVRMSIAIAAAMALWGCEPPWESGKKGDAPAPAKTASRAPEEVGAGSAAHPQAVAERPGTGRASSPDPATRGDGRTAAPGRKVPPDLSRIPERLDIAADPRAGAPEPDPAALTPELLPGRKATADRYAPAFARLFPTAPAGTFDVVEFAPPPGLVQRAFDVDLDGTAAFFFDRDDRPAFAARVRVLSTGEEAREVLRDALAGLAATLEPIDLGDLGFANGPTDSPHRVLFAASNVFLEARSLGEESALELARELLRHAAAAPEAAALPRRAHARIGLAEPARAGRATRLERILDGPEIVATHWTAGDDAAVTTSGADAWLLSPTPGEKEIRAVLFDRWLRRVEVAERVVVAVE